MQCILAIAAMPSKERANHLTLLDDVACGDRGFHRFIRRPDAIRMLERDHRLAADQAREDYASSCRSQEG